MIGRSETLKPGVRPKVAAWVRKLARLGVDGVDVAESHTHRERAIRGGAEEQQRVRLLLRAYIGRGALDPVEFAGEIEWSLARQASFINSRYSAARR
jgi:hypothetical protein